MKLQNTKRLEVTVCIWVDQDADIEDVSSNMDYDFDHESIVDTEIVDIQEVDRLYSFIEN